MFIISTIIKIDSWVVAPYKAPERNSQHNAEFNNHVSILHIRSEHAIGFLKGRFQSLKGLRLHIKNGTSHIIATYWVAACIGIHSFALQHEAEERHLEEPDNDKFHAPHDPFIEEGLTDSDSSLSSSNNSTSSGGKLRHLVFVFKLKPFRLKFEVKFF